MNYIISIDANLKIHYYTSTKRLWTTNREDAKKFWLKKFAQYKVKRLNKFYSRTALENTFEVVQ